ncbi:MAG: apocytochrome f [Cyanobacteria bacterium P01_F01_bin.42]
MAHRGTHLFLVLVMLLVGSTFWSAPAHAYPYFAQQAYDNPREATGRIVCANCHLAAQPIEAEVPQSVKPDAVFEAVVKIPYDHDVPQVLGDGSEGALNVGAVVVLPDGFKMAPPERISEELKAETKDLYIQPYSDERQNMLVVGPLSGDQHQEIVFPVLSPNPKTDKSTHFGKYLIHAGGNRGRGQVYPTGDKSNNNIFTAPTDGIISAVSAAEAGGYEVAIQSPDGETLSETIPPGPQLIVAEGDAIAEGAPLTNNPNVGGFGQEDVEIVLQDPVRIMFLVLFFIGIMLSQTMLVLKKKQIEKVQAAEFNF